MSEDGKELSPEEKLWAVEISFSGVTLRVPVMVIRSFFYLVSVWNRLYGERGAVPYL